MHKKKFLFTFSLLGLLLTSCSGGSPYIGENGNWWVGDTDTGVNASGLEGEKGDKGDKGDKGEDGVSPEVTIGENGNWFINGEDTGIKAQGEEGEDGKDGKSIVSIEKTSSDGLVDTYTISYSDGSTSTFTVTNGEDGIQGEPGEDGKTPVITIGENGNWIIDGEDTGIKAKGEDGADGQDGKDGEDGKSAYEIYIEAHPEYTKTEEEWLDDLVNGELGNKLTHTVTFDTGCEIEVEPASVEHGELIPAPTVPKREGYELVGWYYEGYAVWMFDILPCLKDMTLVAQWRVSTHTVTLTDQDGRDFTTGTYEYGTIFDYDFTYAGAGNKVIDKILDQNGNEVTLPLTITDDLVLTVYYVESIMITFDTQTEEIIEPMTIDNGIELEELPIPTRENYYFLGWYYMDEGFETKVEYPFNVRRREDLNLVAKWGAISEIGQFEYTELDETSVAITNYVPVGGEELVIPDGIDGKKVTELWRDAFVSLNIKTVKLGAYVYFIDDNAFSLCKDIETIVYNKVPNIKQSYFSFNGSYNITNIEALPTFDFNTLFNTTYDCFTRTINYTVKYDISTEGSQICKMAPESILFNVKFGTGYKTIRSHTVTMAKILSIDFPEGVTKIETYAVSEQSILKVVKFPNSLLEIEDNAFIQNTSFNNIITGNKIANVTLTSFGDSPITNIFYMGTDEEFAKFTENFELDISNLGIKVYTNVQENEDCYYYANGTAVKYLLRKTDKAEKIITIPSEIDGLPVMGIQSFAINAPEAYAVYLPSELIDFGDRSVNTYNPTMFYMETSEVGIEALYYSWLSYDPIFGDSNVRNYYSFGVSPDKKLLYEGNGMVNLYYKPDKLILYRYLDDENAYAYINDFDGMSISAVGYLAFSGLNFNADITFGENVEEIYETAFYNSTFNTLDLRKCNLILLRNLFLNTTVNNFYAPLIVEDITEEYYFSIENYFAYNSLKNLAIYDKYLINNLYYSGNEEEWMNISKFTEDIANNMFYDWVE